MTERYSDGAMRAMKRIPGYRVSNAGDFCKRYAAMISEETGDLALIEALERARSYVQSVHGTIASAQGHEQTIVKPDLDLIDAALAAARKEG